MRRGGLPSEKVVRRLYLVMVFLTSPGEISMSSRMERGAHRPHRPTQGDHQLYLESPIYFRRTPNNSIEDI